MMNADQLLDDGIGSDRVAGDSIYTPQLRQISKKFREVYCHFATLIPLAYHKEVAVDAKAIDQFVCFEFLEFLRGPES